MKIKTSELTGVALDWAVAKCVGLNPRIVIIGSAVIVGSDGRQTPIYPTDWAQGGPIIEREEISTAKLAETLPDAMVPHPVCWSGHIDGVYVSYGPTPLIAALRCYVASKLGDEVDVPEELL